jgi:membrane protein DedA with SNARE-associated domain
VSGSTFLVEQVALYGPWLIFMLAALETSFVTGFVVPAGVATSAATVLALEGTLSLEAVVVSALAGGFVGDTVGFWIGRMWGDRVLASDRRWSRKVRARHAEIDRFFGRHPVVSVSLARAVAFVRTVMPLMAGMSGMRYRRYMPYEVGGLLLWASIYVAIGLAGQEGWEVATRLFGVVGTVVFLAGTGVAFLVMRRRRGHPRRTAGARGGE